MGISLGIMQPDPRPVLMEAQCPGCKRDVRGTAQGHAGEELRVQAQCDCGTEFTICATAKELDS